MIDQTAFAELGVAVVAAADAWSLAALENS